MIGIDWGTSRLRAFRIDKGGAVRETRSADRGITRIPEGGFEDALREIAGDWLEGGETRVLLSGMVGSRRGWRETPYLPCPAGAQDIAGALLPVPLDGAEARIVPGLTTRDPAGIAEIMRGEETQIIGALPDTEADALICLPGSHSKWATVTAGKIATFSTFMTGEAFAALGGHTILAQTIGDFTAAPDAEAFRAGLARAMDPGGLLHHLFGVRTKAIIDGAGPDAGGAYLSGLLIGHEIAAAPIVPGAAAILLIGEPALCRLYRTAIEFRGGHATIHGEDDTADAAAAGLARLGATLGWC